MATGSEVKKKVSPPKRATGDWWKGRKLLDNKNKTKVGTGSSGPSTRQSNKPTKAPSTPNTPKAPSTPNKQIHQRHQKHQAPQLAKVTHVLLLKRRKWAKITSSVKMVSVKPL
jgi:hypothetical protein